MDDSRIYHIDNFKVDEVRESQVKCSGLLNRTEETDDETILIDRRNRDITSRVSKCGEFVRRVLFSFDSKETYLWGWNIV